MHIGMLLYPDLTQLDLTGPHELFTRLGSASERAKVHLIWKRRGPVRAGSGMEIVADTTMADCPPLDLLFVPGGFGQAPLQEDAQTIDFLRTQGARAKWVTSVCTGALLLGAAGLLDGYEATTHWAYVDQLARFGAKHVERRVVVDRNRVTAGGVTAGIDFGLHILAEISGEKHAKLAQLSLEYDPAPPYACGHPDRADEALVDEARAGLARRFDEYLRERATKSAVG